MAGNGDEPERNGGSWICFWLLIPLLVRLCAALQPDRADSCSAFPFFYWFQLAWIFVSMVITACASITAPNRARRRGKLRHAIEL